MSSPTTSEQHINAADRAFDAMMVCLDQAATREAGHLSAIQQAADTLERADQRLGELEGYLQQYRRVCAALSWALNQHHRRGRKQDRPVGPYTHHCELRLIGDAKRLDAQVVQALADDAAFWGREVSHAA